MNWKVLGIEETKDKNAIKNAYREILSSVNPEDDPKKFMELRKAYEDALEFADQAEAEVDDSPLGLWLSRVENVYNVFSKRLDVQAWKELLEDDICNQFDTGIDARDKLLEFIMDHYYFPRKIWTLLNEKFDLLENRDNLYEDFPKNFVDYCVVSGIENDEILKYDLFEINDNCDYETFISKFFEVRRNIRNQEYDDCERLLNELDELEIFHPYLEAERMRYYFSQDRMQEADDLAVRMKEQFPDEVPILYMYAEIKYKLENYDEAKTVYEKILELSSGYYYAIVGVADCYMHMKKFCDAKEWYLSAIKENSYDNYVRNKLDEVNEELFAYYEDKIKENPEDIESRFELGWCYLQSSRCKDIINLFDDMQIPDEKILKYYNLMSRTYHDNDENDKATQILSKWKNKLIESKNNEDDSDSEENPIIKVLYLQGCISEEEKKYEDAIKIFDEILELDSKNLDAYIRKAVISNDMCDYENTIDICDKINELDSFNFTGYYQKAVALFELRYYYDALDSFEESINVYSYYLDAYIYKIRIYLIYDEYDKAKDVIDYLDGQNIDSCRLEFYKARLLNCQDKYEEALELYKNVIEKAKSDDSDMNELEQVYYYMSIIEEEENEDRNKATEYIKKALEINPNDIGSNAFYGNILKNDKKYEEAIKQFEKALELNPSHSFAYNEIGRIYEEMDDIETALTYHTKQLDNDSRLYYRIHRGRMYMALDRFDEAREDFNIAIEMDPENPNPYNNIGVCYQYEDELESALKYYEKAIETLENEPFDKIYRNMATTYVRLKEYDKAVECYEKCIEAFNVTYDHYEMASIYKMAGMFDKAREKLKDWIMEREKTTEHAYYYQEIATCYYQEGNDEECMKNLEKAYSIDPKDTDTLDWLGSMSMKSENYVDAIRYYKEYLKEKPESAYRCADLAEAYKKSKSKFKMKKNAKKALEKAFDLGEKSLEGKKKKYMLIGKIYSILEDYENAQLYFNKCLELRKCNDCNYIACCEVYYDMGSMYEDLSDIKKANECYEQAFLADPASRDYKEAVKRTSQVKE